ncbi:hypothetical protein Bpfe_010596, partial [Biomphalaria pfeifferi]
GNTCSHQRSINLPKDGKCLVPVKTAYDWVTAQAACERAGGSLYQHPNAFLQSRPNLMNCLASISETTFDDMWLNAVGMWYPHFFWINMTLVNKINYCTELQPPKDDSSSVPITSDTLSVDYCVSTCHDRGARFIVLHSSGTSFECYCKHELETKYMSPCKADSVSYLDKKTYFIVHAQEDNLIKLASSEAFSKTEILCATVDQQTKDSREMRSDTCFTNHPFICCLGEAAKCNNNTQCTGTECRFLMRDKCMLRVAINYNWYAARAYCVQRGGDLWNMHELNEMNQVTQFLDGQSRYWIGATNYAWSFNATSVQLNSVNGNFNLVKCGHMFRERTNVGVGGMWQWGDTVCDQQKSFLCEFVKTAFTSSEINEEVVCPWPVKIIVIPTETPVVIPSGGYTGDKQSDSFPLAAVIAACVAALVLLTCLALAFGYCHRQGKFKKAKEHLAFIPYFADVNAGPDYSATMHSNMSSVSEHGSQIGLMKGGGFQSGLSAFATSTSYGEHNGVFSTQSLDRAQKDSMARKLAESQHYLAGNTSMDERGFASTYNTMPVKSRGYMTLQAQMDIKDEAELAALRGSLRGKPEVTLVTDNVDMNFTVNHAISRSHSHAGSDQSRSSLERTMEEITLPVSEGGMLRNLPERVAEARIYSNQTST